MAKTEGRVDVEEFQGDPLSSPEAQSTSATIKDEYYDFKHYVSKTRMLTFYHQIAEVMDSGSLDVLEVGIGPKVVAGSLREFGTNLKTIDINASLKPDYVGSVTELSEIVGEKSVDVVLCARVLHHLSFSQFEKSIAELSKTARKKVILTLPCDELRVYFGFRRTAGQYKILSLKLPTFLKRMLLKTRNVGETRYAKLWKIDSHSETRKSEIVELLERYFTIEKSYHVPEDQSHAFFILSPR